MICKKLLFLIAIVFGNLTLANGQTKDSSGTKTDTSKIQQADGSSYERAIVITEKTEGTGTAAEYAWIRKNYPGSVVSSQSLNFVKHRSYDVLHITTDLGFKKSIYFDISNFFGKF